MIPEKAQIKETTRTQLSSTTRTGGEIKSETWQRIRRCQLDLFKDQKPLP